MKKVRNLLNEVKLLSVRAGEAILEIYKTDFNVQNKEDNTPVTAADMAAHHLIVDGLMQLTPDVPVLSEESTYPDFKVRAKWKRYWLVDPLDGTKEFVKRSGEFSVNIALIDDHKPILGVIYSPVNQVLYFASKHDGAFKAVQGQSAARIEIQKMSAGRITAALSRSYIGPRFKVFLESFGEYTTISLGSSLKSCLVAEGGADIYPRFGPTSEWDTGAAQCIVEEAGGMLVDTDLQPLRYNTKDSLLNPYFIVVGDRQFDWSPYMPHFSHV